MFLKANPVPYAYIQDTLKAFTQSVHLLHTSPYNSPSREPGVEELQKGGTFSDAFEEAVYSDSLIPY